MIRINKPSAPPAVLKNKGVARTEADCAAFDSAPASYYWGVEKFEFASDIYGHKSVKTKLIKCQHGKCAFCESPITHVAYGDVEHFRPKAAFRQSKSAKLERPGYYWLAYAWNNLFLSCQLCNQRFKANLFPLENSGQRARSHQDDLSTEDPLIVDPGKEDPAAFISFRMEQAFPADNNPRGKTTIETLGLNRPELARKREEHYRVLKLIHALAEGNPATRQAEDARKLLEKACRTSEPYAAMVQCAIKNEFGAP